MPGSSRPAHRTKSALTRRIILSCIATIAAAAPALGDGHAGDRSESDLLTNVRQLTFEGLRAGEGYFNAGENPLLRDVTV